MQSDTSDTQIHVDPATGTNQNKQANDQTPTSDTQIPITDSQIPNPAPSAQNSPNDAIHDPIAANKCYEDDHIQLPKTAIQSRILSASHSSDTHAAIS